ncbi:MAG: hypothetical protein GY847_30225 [Proteobacteria bacterium]|nr:hypothetical protein [Pseudomonadota bacterium]
MTVLSSDATVLIMKRLIVFIAFTELFLLGTLPVGAVVNVPSPITEKAFFSESKKNTKANKATDQGFLNATGGDGARVVVFEAAVITAIENSKILRIPQSGSNAASISLVKGGFHLYVGSKPVVFKTEKVAIEVLKAELLIAQFKGLWYVNVVTLLQDGYVKVVEIGQSSTIAAPAAVLLQTGRVFQIGSESDPKSTSEGAENYIEKLSSRLTVVRPPFKLQHVDLEDPLDLTAASKKRESEIEDIEMETIEIEVETDCVEICIE